LENLRGGKWILLSQIPNEPSGGQGVAGSLETVRILKDGAMEKDKRIRKTFSFGILQLQKIPRIES
jgi:hypothetical protein